jgi:hypothetical protein
MINPTAEDIGRGVVYYGKHEDDLRPAYGTVTSFDQRHVFVRYDDSEPIATRREELIWTEPEMTQIAPSDRKVHGDRRSDVGAALLSASRKPSFSINAND